MCVAAVIGPLCSASGPGLIFITRFINKQISGDTFLERMKGAGVFLSLKITFSYIYMHLETNVGEEQTPFQWAVL